MSSICSHIGYFFIVNTKRPKENFERLVKDRRWSTAWVGGEIPELYENK